MQLLFFQGALIKQRLGPTFGIDSLNRYLQCEKASSLGSELSIREACSLLGPILSFIRVNSLPSSTETKSF